LSSFRHGAAAYALAAVIVLEGFFLPLPEAGLAVTLVAIVLSIPAANRKFLLKSALFLLAWVFIASIMAVARVHGGVEPANVVIDLILVSTVRVAAVLVAATLLLASISIALHLHIWDVLGIPRPVQYVVASVITSLPSVFVRLRRQHMLLTNRTGRSVSLFARLLMYRRIIAPAFVLLLNEQETRAQSMYAREFFVRQHVFSAPTIAESNLISIYVGLALAAACGLIWTAGWITR
jgi:hypothetical protein